MKWFLFLSGRQLAICVNVSILNKFAFPYSVLHFFINVLKFFTQSGVLKGFFIIYFFGSNCFKNFGNISFNESI